MAFDLGDIVPLSAEVRNAAGALANAGAITLTITLPDGTTAPGISITNPPAATGVYVYDYTPVQAGRHTARWLATGANACAFSDAFDVREATPLYIVSLADAKAAMNWTTADSARDEEFRRYVEGATVIIEDKVGPVVVRSFTERVNSGQCLILRRTPVVSLTSIEPWLSIGTSYTVADVRVDADTGIIERLDGGYFSGGPFAVIYKAGRTVIPANITIAALDLIRINFRPQQGGNMSRYDEPGETRADYGMFVPNSVMANLAPQEDAGIA